MYDGTCSGPPFFSYGTVNESGPSLYMKTTLVGIYNSNIKYFILTKVLKILVIQLFLLLYCTSIKYQLFVVR